jgi:O-antigen/teichoic acid export membrane protein
MTHRMNGPAPRPSTRRDLISAYVATAARIGAWVVVAAVVMRRFGTDEFALLALVRGTLSILNYGTLGLGPAMIHHLARRDAGEPPPPRTAVPVLPVEAPENVAAAPAATIAYANPTELADPLHAALRPLRETYAAGMRIVLLAGLIAVVLLCGYASNFEQIHQWRLRVTGTPTTFVFAMGLGAILRIVSDAPGAVLQVRDRITRDNAYQCAAELIWVLGVLWSLSSPWMSMSEIAIWFLASSAFLLVARLMTAATITQQFVFELPNPPPGLARTLLADGGVIVLGQLANYLYAPAAMILISRLLDAELVAYYEAAVQVDAALLLLVTALATVLLPKAAVAHAADDRDAVRRYYVRGTLASLAMLTAGAVAAVALAPWIYPLWLGEEMRTTRAILPTLLVATVVGGSGMVGRSILLAMGKAKPFTVAALAGGIANVVLAFVFVKLGWGLRGIVTATAIVVIARAGIWQPWYVMRTLRRGAPAAIVPLDPPGGPAISSSPASPK